MPVFILNSAGEWLFESVQQRVDERHLVDVLGHVREDLGDPRPALAVLGQLERRLHQRADLVGEEAGVLVEALEFLPVALVEFGLVVPGIDVGRPAVHEQPDDRLGLGRRSAAPSARAGPPAWSARQPVAGRPARACRTRRPRGRGTRGASGTRSFAATRTGEVACRASLLSIYSTYRNSFRQNSTWQKSASAVSRAVAGLAP